MGKPNFVVRRSRWILAHCPCSGEEVVASGWDKQFSIPNGQASWWHCPACHGWHIVMVSDQTKKKTKYDPAMLVTPSRQAQPIRPTSGIIFIKVHEPEFVAEYFFQYPIERG